MQSIQETNQWATGCSLSVCDVMVLGNSRGQAEMRGHGLIQRGQALVFFLFSAVNGGEGSGSRKMDARRVGVRHDLVSLSRTSGKKGDERWQGA